MPGNKLKPKSPQQDHENLEFATGSSISYRPVEDTSTYGPEFAATPGVAARGPKTGAAECV